MLRTKQYMRSLFGSVCLALALSLPAARAATCPPDANTTGVAITLSFEHQNGSFIGAEGADACETIRVIAVVSYPNGLPGQIVEAFSGGTITILGNNVTPVGGVPLIGPGVCAGAVLAVQSQVLPYIITAADILAGKATVTAQYTGGTTTSGQPVSAQVSQDTPVKPAVTVGISQSSAVCQGAPVTLTATPAGGIPPYTLVWRNGATQVGTGTTFSPSTATAGSTIYTVTVTDAQNCTGQATVPVVVNPNPVVTVSNSSVCQGNTGVITATVTGSTAATFHYVWTGPTGTGPFSDAAAISATVAGSYSVVVTDNNGCVGRGSGVLSLAPKPVVVVSNASICSGTSATLTAAVSGSTAAPFHFNWSGPAGTGSFADAASITATVAGTYTVTVSDANQCVGQATGIVTVNQRPGVQVANAAICAGRTGTLTANVTAAAGLTFSYAWSGPAGTGPFQNAASITSGVAGTYTVTVTDNNGCSSTGTGIIIVNPIPIVAVNSPSVCQGNSGVITATVTGSTAAPFHYVWTGPTGTGPFSDAASISATVAGSYLVTVTDNNGCVGNGAGVLSLTQKPVVLVSNASICSGTSATLTAAVSGSTAAPFHFTWNGPAGTGPFADAASITATVAGTYTATVSDANQCIGQGTGIVTVNQKPIVQVNSAAICAGTTGTLTATVTGGAGSTFGYVWSGPTGTGPFGNAPTITVSVSGTYNVTVTDSNGCTGTGTGLLLVNANPIVQVSSAAVCQNSPATIVATVTGSTATTFHYAWTGPAGTGPFSDASAIVATVAGTYCVTVRDANNCTGTGCGTVSVNPVPVVTVNSPSVCQGSPATLTASVAGSAATPFTFAWSGPAGTGPFSNLPSITTTVGGLYTVAVTDRNGCVGASSGTVTVNAKPFVGLQPITICSGKTTKLTATADACGPFTFRWTGPTGFTATGNPVDVTAAGTYTVTITDCHNCTSSASAIVSVNNIICQIVEGCCCTICAGSSQTLHVSQFGGIAPYTYLWKDVTPGRTGATVGTASTFTTGVAGDYTVTVTDSLGCSCTTLSTKIGVDTVINVFAFCVSCQNPQVCNGSSVQLSAASSGGVAPFQYLWQQQTPNGGFNTLGSDVSLVVTQPGTYVLNVIDAYGCSGSFTQTVLSCNQCVTRDASFWFSHVVPPPGVQLPAGQSCTTLQSVFNLMPNGLMNLGFLNVNLNQALGLFFGTQSGPGTGGRSPVCAARKQLATELISAIANVTLLNADSSSCGVQDPNSGSFVLVATLIQEAQAALQVEPNIFDCNNQIAWTNDMNGLMDLLHMFNQAGTGEALPSNLVSCGVGQANALYIQNNQVDPTTTANCGCPTP